MILLTLAIVTAACAADDTAPATPDPGAIDGAWELTGGTLDGAAFPLVAEWRVTMSLDNGTIGGTAACNGYGGSYDRDASTITLTEWSITEMGCQADVMASEQAFLAVLQRPITLTRTGDTLSATGEGFDLQFALIPPVATAELVGTVWQLHTIIKGDAAIQFLGDASLVLDPNGTFQTSTGCRQVDGTYQLDADQLVVTQMGATGECPPDLARQDSDVISVFENARIEIEGNQLRLLSTGGDGLQFTALDA
jgi:heat shock protein HslJ